MAAPDRTLVECLRLECGVERAETCRVSLEETRDHHALLVAARRHGVGPLLYGVLRRHDLEGALPAEVVSGLKEAYRSSAATCMLYRQHLEEALLELAKRRVSPVVLKSLPLADELYEDAAERPFGDIDLLITEESWVPFRETMLSLGFDGGRHDSAVLPQMLLPQITPDHYFDFCLGPDKRVIIETKFDPLEVGLRMRGLEGFRDRALPLDVGGAPALRPCPEDELLMLCVHLNRHGFQRLIWLVDVAKYVSRYATVLDWDTLLGRAAAEGMLPPVHFTLRLIESLFGPVVPAEAIAASRPGVVRESVWRSVWPMSHVLSFDGRHEAALVFRKRLSCEWLVPNLVLVGRAPEKLLYFARRAFPPRDMLLARYPARGAGSSYLASLGRRYATAFWGLRREGGRSRA